VDKFENIEPEVWAHQLSYIDHQWFNCITANDVIKFNRVRNDAEKPITPVSQLVTRYQALSRWVVYTILSESSVPARVTLIKQFLELMEELQKVNNFYSLFAILIGLTHSSVEKLVSTWRELPHRYEQKLKKFQSILPVFHLEEYMKAIQKGNPPVIPYLQTFLRDFDKMESSQSALITSPKTGSKLINVERLKAIYKFYAQFKKYFAKPLGINSEKIASIQHYLLTLKVPDDKELYEMSKKITDSG